MRKFKFAKLVRDKIPGNMKKDHTRVVVRVLEDKEYVQELKKKVQEEADELIKAPFEELAEEVADMQELVDNFLQALKLDKKHLKKLQDTKNKKYGSFKKRLYVEMIEIAEDNEWVKQFLKNPDRYPEIK